MTTKLKSSEEVLTIGLGCIGAVILVVGIIAATSIYFGWAIALLWSWFLVPLGVPQISMLHAIGLIQLVHVFRPAGSGASNKEWITVFSAPVVAVLIGLIVKHYM